MKKLLSLLGVLTITSSGLSILTNNNLQEKNLKQINHKLNQHNNNNTTPIPGTAYYITNSDIILATDPNSWGNNFVFRIANRASQILSRLVTLQNSRDAAFAFAAALGIGAAATTQEIQIALGVSAGIASLVGIFLSRINESPETFTNFFRNNDISNGLNLAVNENGRGVNIWVSSSSGSWPSIIFN